MIRFLIVLGTRPEAVKLARVIHGLRGHGFDVVTCVTGQHRDLLDPMLTWFDIQPDLDLRLMQPRQTLDGLTNAVLAGVTAVIRDQSPDRVVVQGDTTTAFAAALAGFYAGVKVAHIEAGLRTGRYDRPYPEEANRRMIAALAHEHFAPTERAKAALLREGVPDDSIRVTGNTGIDALLWTIKQLEAHPLVLPGEPVTGRSLLVTLHRREHSAEQVADICSALKQIVARFPDVTIVLPVHLNPQVYTVVHAELSDVPRIRLYPPLAYPALVQAMSRAEFVLTDSGGIQEEAPALGRPVLVLREQTERPEAVESGGAQIVGTDPKRIVAAAASLLENPAALARMRPKQSPFGDGTAAEQIAQYFLSKGTSQG